MVVTEDMNCFMKDILPETCDGGENDFQRLSKHGLGLNEPDNIADRKQ